MLTEAGVVAPGSLNTFLSGKMYNRNRRGYILLAVAFRSLHFIQFMKENNISYATLEEIKTWNGLKNNKLPQSVKHLLIKYQLYTDDTLQGMHGKTAHYWMMIVEYVDLYLLLHRGIKINNVELYSFALYELTPIFFQTNHLNYARWMTYHSIELTNVKDDRPEIHKMLTGGAFSINRKGNPFTQVGVDMGLEQKINTDAKIV